MDIKNTRYDISQIFIIGRDYNPGIPNPRILQSRNIRDLFGQILGFSGLSFLIFEQFLAEIKNLFIEFCFWKKK